MANVIKVVAPGEDASSPTRFAVQDDITVEEFIEAEFGKGFDDYEVKLNGASCDPEDVLESGNTLVLSAKKYTSGI